MQNHQREQMEQRREIQDLNKNVKEIQTDVQKILKLLKTTHISQVVSVMKMLDFVMFDWNDFVLAFHSGGQRNPQHSRRGALHVRRRRFGKRDGAKSASAKSCCCRCYDGCWKLARCHVQCLSIPGAPSKLLPLGQGCRRYGTYVPEFGILDPWSSTI
jgi:hypothetical protein